MTERRLTLRESGRREFRIVEPGVCYALACPGVAVTFELDRLAWARHELSGELLVRADFEGTDGIRSADGTYVLSVARFNVSSSRARAERAAQLEKQARAKDIPWLALIEELCQSVLAAERTGDPAIALRDVVVDPEDQRTIPVSGFLLPARHPAILFGDGASCKSYLALYLAGLLAQDGYRVALVDWELDAVDHRERYERLFGAEMPATLFYTRCYRPLLHDVDRLQRIVRLQGIDYAIFDSIGFACHEAPEAAESALTYFRCVRQLGIGSLHLAHVAKGEGSDQKPFGSAFHFNSARAIWNIKATDDGAGGLTLGVFDRKPSLRARQQPFALDVTFTDDRTTIRRCDIAGVEAFAPQISLYQRIRSALKAGAMTREQLAEAVGEAKAETLSRTLHRAFSKGHLVRFPGAGGVEQIGLPARTAS